MDSELLYVFGTGNATVTNLYNTCFALRDGDEYFMVDAGGGNGILKILDNMQVPVHRIHHEIFVAVPKGKACIIKVGHRRIAGSKNVKKLPVHEKIPFLVWSFKYEYVTIKWKEKQSPAEEK